MMTPAALRKHVAGSLLDALAPRGFVARGQFLVRRRLPMVTDWLAIVATGWRGGGIDATVNAGVHCAPMHRLLDELSATKYSETNSTFSTNIGYLEDAHRYREWPFERHALDHGTLTQLQGAVRTIAVPFCERFVDYPSVRAGCQRYGMREYNHLRLPALDYLAGDTEGAVTLLEETLSATRDRTDMAAEWFRASAARLLKLCRAAQ